MNLNQEILDNPAPTRAINNIFKCAGVLEYMGLVNMLLRDNGLEEGYVARELWPGLKNWSADPEMYTISSQSGTDANMKECVRSCDNKIYRATHSSPDSAVDMITGLQLAVTDGIKAYVEHMKPVLTRFYSLMAYIHDSNILDGRSLLQKAISEMTVCLMTLEERDESKSRYEHEQYPARRYAARGSNVLQYLGKAHGYVPVNNKTQADIALDRLRYLPYYKSIETAIIDAPQHKFDEAVKEAQVKMTKDIGTIHAKWFDIDDPKQCEIVLRNDPIEIARELFPHKLKPKYRKAA